MRLPPLLLTVLGLALALGLPPTAPSYAQPTDPVAPDDSAAEQTVDLTPGFVAGRTARYRRWTLLQQQITMALGDNTQTVNQKAVYEREVIWTVQDVAEDGSATCVMTQDWVTVIVTSPDGEELVSDSRQETGDNESLHQALVASAGVPVQVTVAPDGSVTSISGVDAIRQRAPEGRGPEDIDLIRGASNLATIPFAPAGLAVGDDFEVAFKSRHDMSMRSVSGYLQHQGSCRLTGVERIAGIPVATVEGKTTFTLEADTSGLPPEAPPVDIRLLGGEQTSQVLFDLLRHETVGRNITQSMQYQMSVSIGDKTLVRTIDETVQSQVLRIAEE